MLSPLRQDKAGENRDRRNDEKVLSQNKEMKNDGKVLSQSSDLQRRT